MPKRRMKLVAYLKTGPTANLPGAWRHPAADLDDLFRPERYEHLARVLEGAMFDGCFFADTFGISDIHRGSFRSFVEKGGQVSYLDPLMVAPFMIRVTKHLGVGPTLSTTFHPPYLLARMLASLDMLSGGRACWNIVTSHADLEARNFGLDALPPKERRYDQADEVLEACCALWNSWEPDALVLDKARGVFADPDKVHYADYRGQFVRTRGPLGVPHTPQGRPVFLQAGSSPRGRDFAARWAEAVFVSNGGKQNAIAFRSDIHERLARHGRPPGDCLALLSMTVVLAETDAMAREKADYLLSLTDPDMALAKISSMVGADLTTVSNPAELEAAQGHQGISGTQDVMLHVMKTEGVSLADAARQPPRGLMVGSAATVADQMQDLFEAGACDGFIVWPTVAPLMYEEFARYLTPELQRRGLLRTAFTGTTMRDNLRD